MPLDTADPGFDPDALRAKYQAERDKRLRPDANAQYVEVQGDFRHYVDDPYVEPGFTRAPLTDSLDAVVIGGGFGGLLAAARLREVGVETIRIIEKGGDFGGTWYWNRYPGAQCDIESYIYLPLLEETGYVPREKYSFAAEIREHAQRIGERFGLYEDACFQTEIRELRWLEDERRWLVATNRGDAMKARYVVMSNGPLNRPKLPGIPGIDRFGGHSFHTSRWDYAYTGGDSSGGLTGLADKRVGVIGTGATAIQCVPHLGRWAKQLYVFQRTPSSVDLRGNRPTDADWAASLTPGWQKRRMENFNILVSGGMQDEDLVSDGWTDIIRSLASIAAFRGERTMSPDEVAAGMELADFRKMNQIRARVDASIEDRATAEALKPWYRQFCKRPCFHDEYLQTFNRPNVRLVDTDGRGVDRITPGGVVVGETEYPLDCLIYATGFEVGTDYTRRSGYDVVGAGGLKLSEYWSDGPKSMFGMHVHGFPNLFVLGHTHGGFTANYPHLLDEAGTHMSHVLRYALDHDVREVEVEAEAEAAWGQTIIEKARNMTSFQEQCTPGYYNNEGRPSEGGGLIVQSYGDGPIAFFQLLAAWRSAGDFAGLDLRP
jgi:cation diffusion facilitator CzcD-associated flavoprotein CzcO